MRTIYTIIILCITQCLLGCFPLSRSIIRVEKQNVDEVIIVKYNDVWYIPNTAFYHYEELIGYVPLSGVNDTQRYYQKNEVVIEKSMIEDCRSVKVNHNGYGWSSNPIRYMGVPVTMIGDILIGIVSLGFVNKYGYSRLLMHEKRCTTISIQKGTNQSVK
jgi:hypothetical protein